MATQPTTYYRRDAVQPPTFFRIESNGDEARLEDGEWVPLAGAPIMGKILDGDPYTVRIKASELP